MRTFFWLLPALLFVGCSSKNVYTPERVEGYLDYERRLPAPMYESGLYGAALEDGTPILQGGGSDAPALPAGYEVVGDGPGYLAGADGLGHLVVVSKEDGSRWEHKARTMVVSAGVRGDLVAFVTAENRLVLLNRASKEKIFSTKEKPVIAVTSLLAAPRFLENLVLFPSLDGKLVLVDQKSRRIVREYVVGSERHFNNLIFLEPVGDRFVAATSAALFSLGEGGAETEEMAVLRVIPDSRGGIYVLTGEGRIALLDGKLRLRAQRKFPFARFASGTLADGKLAVIERQGYLLVMDGGLKEAERVFALPDDIDDYLFADGRTLYYSAKTLSVP